VAISVAEMYLLIITFRELTNTSSYELHLGRELFSPIGQVKWLNWSYKLHLELSFTINKVLTGFILMIC